MARPPLTGGQRRRRRALVTRALLFVTIAVGATLTGWWWNHVRLEHAAEGSAATGSTAWNLVGVAVGVVVGLVWIVSLVRARPPAPVSAPPGGLPSTHSPAEVGWLLRRGRVTLADLAATLVDLTARGFVVPYRRDGGLVLGQGRPSVDLPPHEELVLDWLFGAWIREADLTAKRAAIRADPTLWSSLWRRFVDAVDQRGREDDLVERDVASPAVLTVAALGLGVLVAGVVGTAHGHSGWLAAVIAGALVVAGASAFARRSPEGEALAARWEAFGTELRYGTDVTPHALAYAVSLGEDDAAAAQLARVGADWPAQIVHVEVESQVNGWREAHLAATSVRGEPSERVRAALSLRWLRRRSGPLPAGP